MGGTLGTIIWGSHWGNIGVMLGLYRENGTAV